MNKYIKFIKNNFRKKRRTKLKTSLFFDSWTKNRYKSRKKQFCFNKSKLLVLKSYIKAIHIYIFLFAITITVFFAILFWPVFEIQNINIIKKDDITNIDISYKSVDDIRWKNIFGIDKEKIKENIKNYQQNIKDINIQVVWKNNLKIELESYKWVFDVSLWWKNYLVCENWSLVPKRQNDEIIDIKIENPVNKVNFVDYKIIFEEKYISKITKIINDLEENILNVTINGIIYYETERELHIDTKNNIKLIFDLEKEVEEQIKKLSIFDKDYKKLNLWWIVYVDLRILNKIFYCKTENEFQCNLNIKSIYE